MIDLSLLADGGMGWLDASGPESHLVLSTRVRLARNLTAFPFQGRSSDAERERMLKEVEAAARDTVLLGRAMSFRLDRLDEADRQLLHERHLVSKELAGLETGGRVRYAAALLHQDRAGVMLNEEDHLRLQGLSSGFALPATYEEVDRLDGELGRRLRFAFHPEFGYLTACPTNVGTGLRASVLIHLPGLVLTKEVSRVLQGLAQVGLTFRGLYGEGSEVVGNFFQLSNQTTLGKSETDLLDQLARVVRQVIDYEEQARQVLLQSAPTVIEDKVWRAYGLLRHAQPVVRRGDEPAERRAAWRRARIDSRHRHVHAQQAPDPVPAGPSGRRGTTGAGRPGPGPAAGEHGPASAGRRGGTARLVPSGRR